MNEIYKKVKKIKNIKTRSRNIKNDIYNNLHTYAYNSNDLLITNETYKMQINILSKYIKNLKNIFFTSTKNKKLIYDEIFNINQTISKINNELKNDIKNTTKNYNEKIESNNNNLKGLITYLEQLKEDNFLLENSLKTKDIYIKIFSNEIKNNCPISEKFVLYSTKLREYQIKELTNAQIDLNKISKETNRETLKSHRLIEEIDNLKNEKEKIKSTKLTNNVTKDEIYFSDFEKDESISSNSSDLFSEINYNLDIDLNTINKVKKSNLENLVKKQKEQIKIKNLDLNLKNNSNTNIPKLNLKQIEFNKGNFIKKNNIEIYENNSELKLKNELKNKIKKIKKHIRKEKRKNKKLLKIIKKFESFQKNYYLEINYNCSNKEINNFNKIKVKKNYKKFNSNKEDLDTYPTS